MHRYAKFEIFNISFRERDLRKPATRPKNSFQAVYTRLEIETTKICARTLADSLV